MTWLRKYAYLDMLMRFAGLGLMMWLCHTRDDAALGLANNALGIVCGIMLVSILFMTPWTYFVAWLEFTGMGPHVNRKPIRFPFTVGDLVKDSELRRLNRISRSCTRIAELAQQTARGRFSGPHPSVSGYRISVIANDSGCMRVEVSDSNGHEISNTIIEDK